MGEIDTSEVTRVEVINHSSVGQSGRVYTYWHGYGNGEKNPTVEVSLQDGGQTLKIFIGGKKP